MTIIMNLNIINLDFIVNIIICIIIDFFMCTNYHWLHNIHNFYIFCLQDGFVKKHGIKMGFMSAFVKASAYALTKQPTVNAVIEGNETVYR